MAEDVRVAVIVAPGLPPGLVANTVGVVAVGLGTQFPSLADLRLADAADLTVDSICNQPLPVLQADRVVIRRVMLKAIADRPDRAVVAPFPAFARSIHDYAAYVAALRSRSLDEEEIDGLGLAGPSVLGQVADRLAQAPALKQ